MANLQFEYEWIDPAGVRGAELRATWARFEIRVDRDPVTRLADFASKSIRTSLFLPLYPLAEWLATHWWSLLYEVETPGRSTEEGYESRHSLRSASEGFALPSLSIRPVGESVRLDWRPIRLEAQNIEFAGEGRTHISSQAFRESVSQLLTGVLGRLRAMGVEGTLLEQEWTSILETDRDEEAFCVAAAALGLDPYDLDEEMQQRIIQVSSKLPASVIRDFFAAAEVDLLGDQADQVMRAVNASRENQADLVPLTRLHGEIDGGVLRVGSPWDQGYRFARNLRKNLNLDGQVLGSLDALGDALQVDLNDLRRAIIPVTYPVPAFDAIVGTNDRGSPGFVVSSRHEGASRFAFCRGLFEFLTSPVGESLLVTKARSDRQKRNRAFAAEFLVPAEALRVQFKGSVVGEEEIEDLAAKFGVSPFVILYQIENHHLAKPLSVD
jgi:hypothetical protein